MGSVAIRHRLDRDGRHRIKNHRYITNQCPVQEWTKEHALPIIEVAEHLGEALTDKANVIVVRVKLFHYLFLRFVKLDLQDGEQVIDLFLLSHEG